MPWQQVARQTLGWLIPVGRLWRGRPVYSTISVVFHVGLLLVPFLLGAHVLLWKRALGFAWFAIPQQLADILTLVTIASALGLFFGRAFYRGARSLSRLQDYVWPLLLAVPFITGYICTNASPGAKTYQAVMLLHVFAADLILVMIPFTKVTHCVLAPLSQVVTAVSWKLVPGAGDKVAATLGYADVPNWVENARSASHPPAPAAERKEFCAQ